MKAFIVDSSVVAKWLPPLNNEPLACEARALLADWTRGKIELSVPDLLLIEVANVLWKATRAGRCKPAAVSSGGRRAHQFYPSERSRGSRRHRLLES